LFDFVKSIELGRISIYGVLVLREQNKTFGRIDLESIKIENVGRCVDGICARGFLCIVLPKEGINLGN